MLRLIPICGKLVWRPHNDGVSLQCQWLCRLEPGPKRLFRKLKAGAVKKARPDFGRRERHRCDVDNFESGERSYSGHVEKANTPPRS
jgi:hypothetical protein